jgi:hypothetical protein
VFHQPPKKNTSFFNIYISGDDGSEQELPQFTEEQLDAIWPYVSGDVSLLLGAAALGGTFWTEK